MPSFYALEAVRAAEGRLPDFAELARRAETATTARLGWPAPPDPNDAIDDAEYDLAILDRLIARPEENAGAARLSSHRQSLARTGASNPLPALEQVLDIGGRINEQIGCGQDNHGEAYA